MVADDRLHGWIIGMADGDRSCLEALKNATDRQSAGLCRLVLGEIRPNDLAKLYLHLWDQSDRYTTSGLRAGTWMTYELRRVAVSLRRIRGLSAQDGPALERLAHAPTDAAKASDGAPRDPWFHAVLTRGASYLELTPDDAGSARGALLADLGDMADGHAEAAEFTLGLMSRNAARDFELDMIDTPHLRAAHGVCAEALARELAHVPDADAPDFAPHLEALMQPDDAGDTPWPRRLGYALLGGVVLLAIFDPRLW